MTKRKHIALRGVAVMAALLLGLAGCSTGGSGDESEASPGEKKVTLGAVEGWTDMTSTTAVLKVVLEENGYDVTVTKLSDNTPLYAGLESNDINVLSSSWMERTHKDYWIRYGNKIEDVGVWYQGAQNFLAVPDYVDVKSIPELSSHVAEFDGKIIGIEPGAGLTATTQKAVIPVYGLQDFELVTSSTAAMLTELKTKIEKKEPIVVTLWRPFWANQTFPVRALEDPKNVYKPENLHSVANKKYAAANPKVVELLAAFKMTDEQFASLEDTVINKFGADKEDEAAKAWLEANPDFAETLSKTLK
ncbi:MAG: glycine betaine ABC transporter substrate-binding protein [Microlunatus sp.]